VCAYMGMCVCERESVCVCIRACVCVCVLVHVYPWYGEGRDEHGAASQEEDRTDNRKNAAEHFKKNSQKSAM